MGNEISTDPWEWQSRYQGLQGNQIEMLPMQPADLQILLDEAQAENEPKTYSEKIIQRFGPTLAAKILSVVEKFSQIDASQLGARCVFLDSFFRRLYFGERESIRLAKRNSPMVDAVVGIQGIAPAPGAQQVHYHAYPKQGSMRAFLRALDAYLQNHENISLHLGRPISKVEKQANGTIRTVGRDFRLTSQGVFWSGPIGQMHAVLGMEQQPRSQEGIHFLDLLTYVFQVPADAWHGLHYHVIYDPGLLPFRIGSAGLYSHQINPAGESFIHAEVLIAQDGEVPLAEDVWKDVLATGLMREGAIPSNQSMGRLRRAYGLPKIAKQRSSDEISPRASDPISYIHHYPTGLIGRAAKLDWGNSWVLKQ